MIKVLLHSFLENSVVYVPHPHFHVRSFMQGNSLNNCIYLYKKKKKNKKRGRDAKERDSLNGVGFNLFIQEKSGETKLFCQAASLYVKLPDRDHDMSLSLVNLSD